MAALAIAPTSLYDRVQELELIVSTLDSLDDDELAPGAREQLEIDLVRSIAGTREKIDATASVLAAMEAASAAAAKEIERLQARKKRIEAQYARLTEYVIGVLHAADVTKFDGHTSTLAIRANPVKVVIDTDEYLDIDMLRFPPTPEPEPNKSLIAAALKRGESVPGCRLAFSVRLVRS
jgi:hypothetical protein